jgi:hypothetical protein
MPEERGSADAKPEHRRKLTVDGDVHDVGTSSSGGEHARSSNTGGVVGVDVDRQVRVLLADSSDENGRSLRLEKTGHVLDAEHVDALVHELVDKLQVVLEGVLGLVRVRDVAGVADDGLADTARLLRSIDTELQVLDVVERVEDTEDVETVLDSLLGEVVDRVVPVSLLIRHSPK